MNIIRARRGFSTNCSGANEYFPPTPVLPPPSADAGLGPWSNPDAKVVFRWVTLMPDGSLPPMLQEAISAGDAGDDEATLGANDAGIVRADGAPSSVQTSSTDVPQSSLRGTSGLGLVIFVVLLGALALFGAERLIRGLSRKLKRRSHDDSAT